MVASGLTEKVVNDKVITDADLKYGSKVSAAVKKKSNPYITAFFAALF